MLKIAILEKYYTMDKLGATNRGRVTCASLLLNESNGFVEFIDSFQGNDSEVGEEVDKMPNIVYALPHLKDPKLIAKQGLRSIQLIQRSLLNIGESHSSLRNMRIIHKQVWGHLESKLGRYSGGIL